MGDEKRSFVDQLIAKKGHLVHKIKATDSTGRRAYYFVYVEPSRESAFLKAVEGGSLNLEDYGQIVASCYGEEPNEEVKKLLKEKYDWDV